MDIKTTTNIDVDFYDKKYILVNAKQLDRGAKFLDEGVDSEGNEYSRWLDDGSRFFSITCYYQGELVALNSGDYAAYIRYKKPDGHAVYNYCTIDRFGKIEVALTEQMLASEGICVADLVIVGKGGANVDSNNGEIINIKDTFVLSTMPIHIDVTETAVNNSEIESTYEFNLLNKNMETYWADFEDVMKTSKSWAIGKTGIRDGENTNNSEYWATQSKSWAVGGTNDRSGENTNNSKYWSEQSEDSANKSESYAVGGTGTRDGEDIDNAEYYSQMSKSYAMGGTGIVARDGEDTNNAEYYSRLAKSYTMGDFDGSTGTRDDESAENAKVYMETTEEYMKTTDSYMKTTEGYMNTSETYMNTTEEHMKSADTYMKTAEEYMTTTDGYMDTTKSYMETTDGYMDNTESYMKNAETSETNALDSANRAQSYAVGGTGTRGNEDYDNASYYYNLTKNIVIGLDTGFIPMGTISFSELANVEKATGYVYNISDDFVTDNSFREGEGKSYTAGTNIYYTASGLWDCFGGAASPTATVDEVKYYLGINDEIEIV